MSAKPPLPTMTHWGAYEVQADRDGAISVRPFDGDPDPSPIGASLADGVRHRVRVARPMVRQGWLQNGPRRDAGGRGGEPFVPVPWDKALDLVAGELGRIRRDHGNAAIYAGSYGWASAGRFHHAQSQLRRFLALVGGHTRSTGTYSHAAGEIIVPRILGLTFEELQAAMTPWPVMAEHTQLMVAFGGVPLKNAQISSGGIGRHTTRDWLRRCRDRGAAFVNIGPLRDDLDDETQAEWLPARPNTDVAIMLALAHTLLVEDLHDQAFLDHYCVGFDRFRRYLLGETDGQPKDADWASVIAELDADDLRRLARRMADARTMITVSWSIQRTDHGEQPLWMAVVLAAMLGQIGLPGGGFGFGYGAVGTIGNGEPRFRLPAMQRRTNPIDSVIPVARVADMLLHPGRSIDFDGRRVTYPDIRLVYWAGGNPFHHHQDLNRLVRAWQRPETIVVHEPFWTPTARHADIVLPVTTSLERNDLGGSSADRFLFAMHRAIPPVGEARNDFDIFAGLAQRMGVAQAFTGGRDEQAWLRHLYDRFRQQSNQLPDFETFWQLGHLERQDDPEGSQDPGRGVLFHAFRMDPERNRLATPSGRIEIFSDTIDGFGYDDCPGHPMWMEPYEWLGGDTAARFPLHLTSNQPRTRLHSQFDHGSVSRASKVAGREPVRLHPQDAALRNVRDGDVVRIFNDRGACLAGAVLSAAVRPGVVQLATGAWFDPVDPGMSGSLERHGNPNVLTRDVGTSRLGQGPTAHTTLVQVELYTGDASAVGVFEPPRIVFPDRQSEAGFADDGT